MLLSLGLGYCRASCRTPEEENYSYAPAGKRGATRVEWSAKAGRAVRGIGGFV